MDDLLSGMIVTLAIGRKKLENAIPDQEGFLKFSTRYTFSDSLHRNCNVQNAKLRNFKLYDSMTRY